MTMLSRLREKRAKRLATAIPAISATQPEGEAATVARIATVAVANAKGENPALPRGTAAKLALDDGTEITLLEIGGTIETARHTAQRTYGDRVRSFTALEGIYQAMLEVRAWPR